MTPFPAPAVLANSIPVQTLAGTPNPASAEVAVWEESRARSPSSLPPTRDHAFIFPLPMLTPSTGRLDLPGSQGRPPSTPTLHALVVPAGQAAQLGDVEGSSRLHLRLPPHLVRTSQSGSTAASRPQWLAPRFVPLDSVACALLDAVQVALRIVSPAAKAALRHTALALGEYVMNPTPEPAAATASGCPLSDMQWSAVVRYIRSRLAGGFRLTDLAHVAGLSRAHFCRSFQATCGMSPMKFAFKLRMEWARELVESSPLPIAHVALETGFASGAHFCRAFSGYWRSAPSSLRRLAADW